MQSDEADSSRFENEKKRVKLTKIVFCAEKKKWKPEIKDSWMTFFSSIVKVMKKSETKAEKENQNDPDEHSEHMTGQYRQVRDNFVRGYFCWRPSQELKESQ